MSNETLFQEALTHFPGGVSSPVRAFRAVGGTPKFFKKASGAWFVDEDDQRFLDIRRNTGHFLSKGDAFFESCHKTVDGLRVCR